MFVRFLHYRGPSRGVRAAAALAGGLLTLAAFSRPAAPVGPKTRLSEYGFFTGPLSDLRPAEHVFPYSVNAALFSDYAEKSRFVALPPGGRMGYRGVGAFEFPEGAVLIKNFYYPADARHPEKGRRILETRLLLRETGGWKALTYVWDEQQTEALLEVAGAELPVAWTDAGGKRRSVKFQIPNLNQCKGCHSYDGQFVPLGLTAAQLHRGDQLGQWAGENRLELPEGFDLAAVSALADYENPALPLEQRARAYLDANCAHCHNPHGPASTSGLFLEAGQTDPVRLGVLKPPVAAGRGAGNRKYSIVPGKPQESILVYRMEENDPGVRMPELGRQLAHREGLELIRAWIRGM